MAAGHESRAASLRFVQISGHQASSCALLGAQEEGAAVEGLDREAVGWVGEVRGAS